VSGVVLGLTLADRLGAVVGSEITLVSPVGVDAVIMGFGQPLMKRCVVTGIFDSNNKDYDGQYAFVDIALARDLFQTGPNPGGIEMRLHDIRDAGAVRDDILTAGDGDWRVLTWYDLHRDLYSVMQVERWSAYIILCLIVGVATFNVLGSLTMGVIEKRRDIGVLRALGSTRGSIIRVFMFEGILVGTIGTVLGVAIGLLVCYLQIRYHLFPLDPTVYIIPAIPVEVRWSDFVAVGGASMLLSSLASLYPALRAARMAPAESLRWE
jgi:lipoprotein-releasing system permease protein